MGKIFFSLNGVGAIPSLIGHLYYNGIKFSHIQQIINSLPGETTITKIEEVQPLTSLYRTWKIEAENDNFLDGTEVIAKYNKTMQPSTNPVGYGYTTIDLFDGVYIVDPSAQQTAASPSLAPAPPNTGGVSSPPPRWTITTTYGSVGGGSGNTVISPSIAPFKQLSGLDPVTACVCGADKVGGLHSTWCNKHA